MLIHLFPPTCAGCCRTGAASCRCCPTRCASPWATTAVPRRTQSRMTSPSTALGSSSTSASWYARIGKNIFIIYMMYLSHALWMYTHDPSRHAPPIAKPLHPPMPPSTAPVSSRSTWEACCSCCRCCHCQPSRSTGVAVPTPRPSAASMSRPAAAWQVRMAHLRDFYMAMGDED